MAILVTLVLLLPDVYLLVRHQPAKAVGILMAMHLAIGLVTYNALVRIAPAGAAQRMGLASDGGLAGPAPPEQRGECRRLTTCSVAGVQLVDHVGVVLADHRPPDLKRRRQLPGGRRQVVGEDPELADAVRVRTLSR